MRFIECQQGTAEWHAARCGRVTASEFANAISMVGGLDERQATFVRAVRDGLAQKDAAIVAGYKAVPSSDIIRRALAGEETRAPSDSALRYAADLAIERIHGMPFGIPVKTWLLERGHEMEFQARMAYEARTRAYVTEAGICVTDDGVFGYSTDGLVADDGLIEIKAPIAGDKILAMWRSGDVSEYMHQIQGGMWITGRRWCDFLMYVPELASVGKDLFVKRIHRDDAFIDAMVLELARFARMVDDNETLLRGTAADSTALRSTAQDEPAVDWRNEFLN